MATQYFEKPPIEHKAPSSPPEGRVNHCPHCGSDDLCCNMNCWTAYSENDPDNKENLEEHQCNVCERAFWT